jgi:hypothetical protein
MILWSDGGLKTKEILYYFSKAAASHQIHCQMNFFASYHGHSICDGHFGASKKRLRVKVGAGVVENKEQIIEVFNSIKNTTAGTYLDNVQQLPVVTPFPQKIKCYHLFYFTTTGEIWCKQRWDKGEWVCQKVRERTEVELQEKEQRKTRKEQNPRWKMTKVLLHAAIGTRAPTSRLNKEELVNLLTDLDNGTYKPQITTPPNTQEIGSEEHPEVRIKTEQLWERLDEVRESGEQFWENTQTFGKKSLGKEPGYRPTKVTTAFH